MTPRNALMQLGKLVGEDLLSGRMSDGSRRAGDALAASPESLLSILDIVIAEARKKRPNEKLVTGLLFMIGAALDVLRMMIEGRHATAAAVVHELKGRLAAAARAGDLDPGLLMLIGRQFASAKLDLGDELRGMMVELSTNDGTGDQETSPEQLERHYAALAAALGQDPFAVFTEMRESAEGFPVEQRVGLVASLVYSRESAMREASLGWLLDRSAEISQEVGAMIAAAAGQGLVSPCSCNRMVLARNWLPENRRDAIDAAIRACRKAGVGAASEKEPEIRQVLLSGYDGAGAQSAFVLAKEGRSLTLASLLLKHGQGVKDAWVRRGLRRAEADEMLGQINEEVEHYAASLAAVETCLCNALAINVASRTPPPFGLVDFVETVGLHAARPLRLSGDALMDRLLGDISPERTTEAQVASALKASEHWPIVYMAMQSWFEEGEHVDDALALLKSKKKRLDAVIDRILPDRRSRWAELLAWTAMAVREEDETAWIDLALVARELRGERSLRDIPLAAWIARNTVDAFSHRS